MKKIAEGIYLAIINHSSSEFVLDLCSLPGIPKAKVKSRIVLTPQHAKRLPKAIGENIHRFEVAHEIKDTEQAPILNFGPRSIIYSKGSRNGAFFLLFIFLM
jgi:hypothetical protein